MPARRKSRVMRRYGRAIILAPSCSRIHVVEEISDSPKSDPQNGPPTHTLEDADSIIRFVQAPEINSRICVPRVTSIGQIRRLPARPLRNRWRPAPSGHPSVLPSSGQRAGNRLRPESSSGRIGRAEPSVPLVIVSAGRQSSSGRKHLRGNSDCRAARAPPFL